LFRLIKLFSRVIRRISRIGWLGWFRFIGVALGGLSLFGNDIISLLFMSGLITDIPDNLNLLNLIQKLQETIIELYQRALKFFSGDDLIPFDSKDVEDINNTFSPLVDKNLSTIDNLDDISSNKLDVSNNLNIDSKTN